MKKSNKILISIFFLFLLVALYAALPTNIGSWISAVISSIGKLAIYTIETLGYPGLVILMALESMIVPLPSELVMPFAGFLAEQGSMSFGLIVLFSSLGSLIGSLLSYYIGYYGGNAFVLKIGKYLLLDATDLEKTEKWFQKKGTKTIFFSRFIPVVRHLISIPAGIGKMDIKKFCVYTVLGATLWNTFLTYCGFVLGQKWETIRHYSEYVSISVAVLVIVAIVYVVYRHVKNKKQEKKIIENLQKN